MSDTSLEIMTQSIARLGVLETKVDDHIIKDRADKVAMSEKINRSEQQTDRQLERFREEMHSMRMFILKVAAGIVVVISGADGAVSLLKMVGAG